jgi:hypothetical protein
LKGAGTCPGDFDGDGDVDGSDLYLFMPDTSVLGIGGFADNFGRNRCP